MSMKIKRAIKGTDEINLASSSDIAFLLIIFFMITSAFIYKDGLHLTLPDKSKKPQVVADKEITTIVVKEDETTTLNDKPMTVKEIEEQVTKLVEEDTEDEMIVLVKFDADVRYQKAVEVIDAMKFTKVKKLSLRMIGG